MKKVVPFGYAPSQIRYKNEPLVLNEEDCYNTDNQLFTTQNNQTTGLKPEISLQYMLQKLLLSNRYQVFVITLVVLDTLIVITELLLDLELAGTESQVPEVLHCISLSLLSLFVLEIFLKLFAFRFKFFTSKGDVFDAVVVIVALVLDSVSLHSDDAFGAVGLVIVLRLWRVVRIQNSMVVSVHKRGEKKYVTEREVRMCLQAELESEREKHSQSKKCLREVMLLLEQNNIQPPSSLSLLQLD